MSPGSSDLNFDLSFVGLIDAFSKQYFEIVNGNEIRTTAAFANDNKLSGSSLGLTIRTTDPAGDFFERTFTIRVISDNPLDSDNDQLPDAWELTHFASLTTQGGSSDSDTDGSNNYEEFLFDTLPNDPNSKLDLQMIEGTDRFTIQWFSSSNRSYRLQSSTDLETASWIDSPRGLRVGTDALMIETLLNNGLPRRFFRVLVETP